MDLQQSAAIGLSRALVDMATKDQRIDELETQVMMLRAALEAIMQHSFGPDTLPYEVWVQAQNALHWTATASTSDLKGLAAYMDTEK